MSFLKKIKINIDYLLGKADPSLYAKGHKNSNLILQDWQKRWEIFSDNGCGFVWYGVDSEGNLAEFACDETHIPEAFFNNVSENNKLKSFIDTLPEITSTRLPENLRPELKRLAQKLSGTNDFWKKGANKGLFIFEETDEHYRCWNQTKNPYELFLIPDTSLKIKNLPYRIQQLLKPYHFENLHFRDCQFLDVSKYLFCEE